MKKPRNPVKGARGWLSEQDDQAAFLALTSVTVAVFSALWVMVSMLAAACSEACLTAFWTDSNAVPAVATALCSAATACSVPLGAFLTALSTKAVNCFWASAARASVTLANSPPKPEAISYSSRP